MTTKLPGHEDPFAAMRAATPARVFLEGAGRAVSAKASLAFQLAHARARDAVHDDLDAEALAAKLAGLGLKTIDVHSAARDRRAFLLRPDLGRRLDEPSRRRLVSSNADCDILFVIADGLSARAVADHALPLLTATLSKLAAAQWRVGPVVVVRQGRVAIGDEIGEILKAKLVAVLIGERPGLSCPNSLGVYLTYAPRVGRTDAERNCLSNIHGQGLSPEDGADKLVFLSQAALARKLTGVDLKDEASSIGRETPADRIGSRSRSD